MREESAIYIRDMTDTLNKQLRALNELGQSTEQWDALLIYLVSNKLDNITIKEWEKQRADTELPTLQEFMSFLNSRASLLETLELNKRGVCKHKLLERAKARSFLVQN